MVKNNFAAFPLPHLPSFALPSPSHSPLPRKPMTIEHLALNVPDPVAFASWYGTHLGLRVVRHLPQASETHFLADDRGAVIEIYRNPVAPVPDYRAMHHLVLHLAFSSADSATDAARLLAAGASFAEEVLPPDGSRLIMLRDPWGIALQLCQRAIPLVGR